MLKKLVSSHGTQWLELKRMEILFAMMAKELAMHLAKEEQTLFPYILRLEDAAETNISLPWPLFGTVQNPIRMMILEHEQTGAELANLRQLSRGFTPPPETPEPVTALYEALQAFDADMSEHVDKEDRVLFPRAAAVEETVCTRHKRR